MCMRSSRVRQRLHHLDLLLLMGRSLTRSWTVCCSTSAWSYPYAPHKNPCTLPHLTAVVHVFEFVLGVMKNLFLLVRTAQPPAFPPVVDFLKKQADFPHLCCIRKTCTSLTLESQTKIMIEPTVWLDVWR